MSASLAYPSRPEVIFGPNVVAEIAEDSTQLPHRAVTVTKALVSRVDFTFSNVTLPQSVAGMDADELHIRERKIPTVTKKADRQSDIKTSTHFICLQSWQGAVTRVLKDYFEARLFDRNKPGAEDLVEIDTDEVSPEDRELIRVGAVFYWSIGYADRKRGRVRTSDLRFRRLPVWTPEELAAVRARADEIDQILDWCGT